MQDILINFLKMASKVAGKRNTKATFQSNLTQGSQSKATEVDVTRDDDDVYYQSGGAALCDMLKLRYKQISRAQGYFMSRNHCFAGSKY